MLNEKSDVNFNVYKYTLTDSRIYNAQTTAYNLYTYIHMYVYFLYILYQSKQACMYVQIELFHDEFLKHALLPMYVCKSLINVHRLDKIYMYVHTYLFTGQVFKSFDNILKDQAVAHIHVHM